ncbi:MAG: HD domain-containing phosphohydrolase [Rickettsiales bacterium]|nr:HD domain-containing phosphohydrolase [Rickettsiales bacterium]
MRADSKLLPDIETPNFSPRLYGILGLMGAIIIAGVFLIARFMSEDLDRDLNTWQEKLNLVAESRASDMSKYVLDHLKELRSLADNPSLKLYMTELQVQGTGSSGTPVEANEPIQKSYLRNLLVFTAERAGYTEARDVDTIRANIPPESKSGLVVLNNNNQIVVATMIHEDVKTIIAEQAELTKPGEERLIDIQKDKEGDIYIGFVVPVFSIQGEHTAESQIGKVIAIKKIDATFYNLLKHPGITEKTLETILVRIVDGKLEYLSALQDASEPLSKQIPIQDGLAESVLASDVGGFTSNRIDYQNVPVLATSRAINNTPWVLVVKIDQAEALNNGNQRRISMMVFFAIIIFAIISIIVAVWRHAHSRRAIFMSLQFRKLAIRSRAQEQLLRVVSDNQPDAVYIVDAQGTYQFANRKAAQYANTMPEYIIGKHLSDMRGPTVAKVLSEQVASVLASGELTYDLLQQTIAGHEHIMRYAFMPLEHIPVETLEEPTPGVLIVEQDVSEVVHEREERIAIKSQLVDTLVHLVDKRDPFAANHSQLVSQIAEHVAEEMELDDVIVDTTRIAANLMNIGKIVVPTELLTKTTPLTEDEKLVIRDSINSAADLLRPISFEGPVSETLRQWQEKWDGSGPMGIEGEAILVSARIISACNSFIGMVSPRSWRNAIAIEDAIKFMMDHADIHFDRRVVVALVNHIENHNGRAWLQQILGQHHAARH